MQLLDWPFALSGPIDAERDAATGEPTTYTAWERFNNPEGLALNRWGTGPFVRLKPPPLPDLPGVYAITRDPDNDVRYIGMTTSTLHTRWGRGGYSVIDPRNCYTGGQSTNCRINNLIGQALADGTVLDLWFLTAPAAKPIEETLRRILRPPWNIQL